VIEINIKNLLCSSSLIKMCKYNTYKKIVTLNIMVR
jgi:hypothetical protein